jgi:hypothetical protein
MNKKQSGGAGGNASSGHKRHDIDSKQSSIFVIRQQYRQLMRRASETQAEANSALNVQAMTSQKQRVSFAELVQCACFPMAKKSKQLMLVIAKNGSLYTQYEWILQRMSIAVSGEQVAASTDQQVLSRTTEFFDLQIKPDKSNNTHVHVLLSLKQLQIGHSAYSKGIFLHCMQGDSFKVIHFEHVLDGQAQIVITEDSETYDLITSPNTTLYLC